MAKVVPRPPLFLGIINTLMYTDKKLGSKGTPIEQIFREEAGVLLRTPKKNKKGSRENQAR
jgi:hypothetical protein